METSRRRILQSAAAGLALPGAAGAASPKLPTVKLGNYDITRLLIGSNPFNGFSYGIPALDQHMREWYTVERIVEVLRRAEAGGINTHQFSYFPKSMEAWERYRAGGGSLQFIVLGGGEMKDRLELIPQVAKLKPLAIVHHGGVTDQRFDAGEHAKVREFLKRVRDSGVLVGMSTHNPANIEYVEERGWDIDFFMTCFYRISRPKQELRKMLGGELPLGTVFLDSDPERMCRVIKQTRKPCLAFKILGAGHRAEERNGLEAAFRFAYENIKPQDAAIVGMYPRFKDEIAENIELARRFAAKV